MSFADKVAISRRPFLSWVVGVVALAGVAGVEAPRLFPGLFERRYRPTPFDDLLSLLPDRENAVRLGTAMIANTPRTDMRVLAARLRRNIGGHSLALAIAGDLAGGRLTEVQGWVVPDSLAELCVLAAMAERS